MLRLAGMVRLRGMSHQLGRAPARPTVLAVHPRITHYSSNGSRTGNFDVNLPIARPRGMSHQLGRAPVRTAVRNIRRPN